MKHVAIVLSAGSGSRMNSNVAKQYMMMGDKPIIYFALKAFEDSFVDEIVLVCGEADIDFVQRDIVDKYCLTKVKSVVAGGAERYLSVMNGLAKCSGADYIYIHDGARPFIDLELLERGREWACKYDAAVAAVPVKDTIKMVNGDGVITSTPDRSLLWQIQTPQVFTSGLILEAYQQLADDLKAGRGKNITDDAMVVEQYTNTKVRVYMGSYDNIKITTPEDLDFMKYKLGL